jgi:hypothetical protein
MKRITAAAVGTTAVAGLLAATLAGSAAQADPDKASVRIVGAWRMTIDPLPNPGGDPPAFPSRISFARGGVVAGVASKVPPGFTAASADVGAWSQRGRTATFTFEHFLFNASGFAGVQRVTARMTVSKDGTTQSGSATATVLGADGTTVLSSFQVAASGTRMTP